MKETPISEEQCVLKPLAICLDRESIESLSHTSLEYVVGMLSMWMEESKSMLPKSPQELIDLIAKKRYAVVIRDGEVVGGCGWTFEHSGPTESGEEKIVYELGGGIVNPNTRKQGIGSAAVLSAMVIQALFGDPTIGLIALPNKFSRGIIEGELGGQQYTVEQAIQELPRVVYSVGCATCPNRPSNWSPDASMQTLVEFCCDTVWSIPSVTMQRRGVAHE